MTLHLVRLYAEEPKGEAENAVENWVSNYSEWEGTIGEHGIVSPPQTDYVTGFWRFEEQGETPTGILQRLYDNLSSFQGGLWFRAFYHVCDHDAGDDSDCPFAEYAAEWGNVPAGVLDIPDDAEVVVSG